MDIYTHRYAYVYVCINIHIYVYIERVKRKSIFQELTARNVSVRIVEIY
jgi:hypothetical protein